MSLRSLSRLRGVLVFLFASTLGPPCGSGQNPYAALLNGGAASRAPASKSEARGGYTEPELVGIYRPDGRFKKISKLARASDPGPSRESLRPAEVPPSVDLHPIEHIVEDYEPSAHAIRAAKGRSPIASLRDALVTFAYGRERALQAPTHVTTDSKQRLIIADPGLPAVHVLDLTGKNSFRIAGGPQHRMRMPNGVAVDAADNIYVADAKRGIILVYDPQGRFLRYIGSFRGESMFQSPLGIALDRKAGHLYVLDPPVHQLVMLDLEGRVLKRIGNKRSQENRALDYPTEIAMGNDQLLILDAAGSRIQVFDLECNFLKAFTIWTASDPPLVTEMGLALDSSSNIYVSNLGGSTVRIYDRDGQVRGVLGRQGVGTEDFNAPSGVWIDPTDRIYVADTKNSRVQVFHVSAQSDGTQRAGGAAGANTR
ncbi:MAG: hypothetical protein LAO03_20820 [Acidobacteriia bacterium]|nr:hypothetical protein [Terriglobia bacterium]